MPPQITGGTITGHYSTLDVEIDSNSAGTPTQVVLRTTVSISGGDAPGEYNETVVLPVHGAVVTIGSWTFS
jgi:Cu/Ag efflux pump CusA